MSKIFKPRRGTTYTMRSTNKKSTVLAKGEFFLEVPNTGVGTGPSKIIIGDGVTTFENLPIALSGTTTSDVIADGSSSVSAALGNVISGKEMANLFGSLKQAITLNSNSISTIDGKVPFTFAISNGVYGYKRTDGTFVAFKSQADIDSAVAAAKIGTATAAQVLTGYTFTNSSSSGLSGSMPNQGKKTQSLNCGGSYTIPAGYHNGQGSVTANSLASQTKVDSGKSAVTASTMVSGYQGWVNGNKITGTFAGQTKSTTSSTSAQTITPDSGKYLTSVSIAGLTMSGTYTASSRGASLDMGASNTYRYVNTNNVPNTNTGTYTPTSNGTALDMGATNTYRYVNTNTVYEAGKSAGVTTHTGTYTFSYGTGDTVDLGTVHSYRYANASNVYNKGKDDGSYIITSSVNGKVPNIAACMRIINDMTFSASFIFIIRTGYPTQFISASIGNSGSSGRPWDENGGYMDTDGSWERNYGYVRDDNSNPYVNPQYSGFTNPGVTYSGPYADFCVYNVGVRHFCLYICYYPFPF